MNIFIDTSPIQNGHSMRGIGRYKTELVLALRALSCEHTFFTREDTMPTKLDLIHYPFFDLFAATLPLRKAVKTIVTIHDVIPLLFPVSYPVGIRGQIAFAHQRLSLFGVSGVVTDSKTSKKDIIDHLKVPSEKISVVYLAASASISKPNIQKQRDVSKKFNLPQTYFLYVGDINYNKNLPFLIKAMQSVPNASLALVGKNTTRRDIPEGAAIGAAIDQADVADRVRCIDSVSSNEELSCLYAAAHAYVQPSLYEGFGLPVLEAMQCGTPLLCARSGSLLEIAQDAATYFHPMQLESLIDTLQHSLTWTQQERTTTVQKGFAQASKFSWEKTAREMVHIYESCS